MFGCLSNAAFRAFTFEPLNRSVNSSLSSSAGLLHLLIRVRDKMSTDKSDTTTPSRNENPNKGMNRAATIAVIDNRPGLAAIKLDRGSNNKFADGYKNGIGASNATNKRPGIKNPAKLKKVSWTPFNIKQFRFCFVCCGQ